MNTLDKAKLHYSKNADLKVVLEDMIDSLNRYDGDMSNVGMEYIIGKIFGGELKLTFSPDASIYDVLETDGVDGFGYCAVIELTESNND